MNNAIYGKTCENQEKRNDIKLVPDSTEAAKLDAEPHCLDFRIFEKKLAGIQMRKVLTKIDKPFYNSFTVLELSKLRIAQFHYDVIQRRYLEMATLLFTDTVSLMYSIETDDIYCDMWDMRSHFDLSEMNNTSGIKN